jgi:WS/DGAT/MGAT family acyltransferase
MKQLSGQDNMFLQLERGNVYLHVAGLAIYDPSTAPGGAVRFKDVLRFFAAQAARQPLLRRRLVQVPLSLDRPYWIDDGELDIEFHVRHIALPHPGDWRQLCIQVARIHSRPLDRSKPLWEAYVIEGLHNVPGVPPGSFALYTKMHHALIDGESGTELNKALHALTPEVPDLLFEESGDRLPGDPLPRAFELYSRALVQNLRKVPDLARFGLGTAARLASLGAGAFADGTPQALLELLRSGDLGSLLPKMPPPTRFSGRVSAHRVVEAVGLPLDEIKTVRRQVGDVTLNDVFLAVVGGALNKYLDAKGELPDQTLLAMVPMTLRGSDKGGDVGNQVGFTLMPVHSEIAEPFERLKAIHDDADSIKRTTEMLGKSLAKDLIDHLPNVITAAVTRGVTLPKISLIVSNVRGPDVPLFMAGARLVRYLPVSIPIDGLGLNVTGFSYDGTLWICATSCRDMLPDPAFFAECLREAFRELVEAAARHAADKEAVIERNRRAHADEAAADAARARARRGATARKKSRSKAAAPRKRAARSAARPRSAATETPAD